MKYFLRMAPVLVAVVFWVDKAHAQDSGTREEAKAMVSEMPLNR